MVGITGRGPVLPDLAFVLTSLRKPDIKLAVANASYNFRLTVTGVLSLVRCRYSQYDAFGAAISVMTISKVYDVTGIIIAS